MHQAVRSRSTFLTCLLSMFLLLMQSETLRHALELVGAQLQRSDHAVVERPVGDTCLECGLLAGGANAVTSPGSTFAAVKLQADAIAELRGRLAVPGLHHYLTRAPPSFFQHT